MTSDLGEMYRVISVICQTLVYGQPNPVISPTYWLLVLTSLCIPRRCMCVLFPSRVLSWRKDSHVNCSSVWRWSCSRCRPCIGFCLWPSPFWSSRRGSVSSIPPPHDSPDWLLMFSAILLINVSTTYHVTAKVLVCNTRLDSA